VSVVRRRWHGPSAGGDTPVDRLLDATEATLSAGVRELCCLLNRDAASFRRAAHNLLRTTDVRLSAELLRRVVESDGRRVLACGDDGRLDPPWGAEQCRTTTTTPTTPTTPTPPTPTPTTPTPTPTPTTTPAVTPSAGRGPSRIYLGCDGFTARLVTDAEKRKRRDGVKQKRRRGGKRCRPLPRAKRGADQAFKEFKLVTFYDETGEHRLVSVTRQDHHAAGRLMRRDARRCGFHDAEQRPAVVDGGPWIVNQIRRQSLPVTSVGLDFYHLAENVHKPRRCCWADDDPAGLAWARRLLHAAKHQGYEALRDELVTWRRTLRAGPRRRAADLLINYVTDRREMIRYPDFIGQGLQIGSGPTESQCRQAPRRVKGRGKRWDADNAEAVMALEAMEQSGLSTAYWKRCAAGLN
jgi:hypothetical protein